MKSPLNLALILAASSTIAGCAINTLPSQEKTSRTLHVERGHVAEQTNYLRTYMKDELGDARKIMVFLEDEDYESMANATPGDEFLESAEISFLDEQFQLSYNPHPLQGGVFFDAPPYGILNTGDSAFFADVLSGKVLFCNVPQEDRRTLKPLYRSMGMRARNDCDATQQILDIAVQNTYDAVTSRMPK